MCKIRLAVGDGGDGKVRSNQSSSRAQAFGVADHNRAATRIQVAMPQALHDDFGTDASGVAHGDCDSRSRHSLFQFQPSKHLHTMGEGRTATERSGFRDHRDLTRPGGNGQWNTRLDLVQ